MYKIYSKNGITLISLIITIVIMLILAAVSINLIIGDNGLFKKASASANKYKDSADKEQNELDNAVREINGMNESLYEANDLIVDVSAPISLGDSSVINELEIYDENDEKVNYNISATEAYDSDSDIENKLPYYWTRTSFWGAEGLKDGDTTYGKEHSTVFCYTTNHQDTEYTRFLVMLPEKTKISSIKIAVGGNENRTPKVVKVYAVNSYSSDTYQNNIAKREDDGLTLIGEKNFSSDITDVETFEIFDKNLQSGKNDNNSEGATDNNPALAIKDVKYLIVDVGECVSSLGDGSIVNELIVYDENSNQLNYTVSATEAYDSDNGGIPVYWTRYDMWEYSNLNDGFYTYEDKNSTIMSYPAKHTDGYTRFLITLPEISNISNVKCAIGDSDNRTPSEIAVYKVNNYSSDTYQNNIAKRDNTGLNLIGSKIFTDVVSTVSWYSLVQK